MSTEKVHNMTGKLYHKTESSIPFVRELLKEERGISRELQEYVTAIRECITEVWEEIVRNGSICYDSQGVCHIPNSDYEINVFDIIFPLYLKFEVYRSHYEYTLLHDRTKEQYVTTGLGNGQDKWIVLTIVVVDGVIDDRELLPKIRHELKHVLQFHKRGGEDGVMMNDDNLGGDYYHKRRNLLKEPKGTIGHALGLCTYLSNSMEQEAYISELHDYLHNHSTVDVQASLQKSNTYHLYLAFGKCLTLLRDNSQSEELQRYLTDYGVKSYDAMMKRFIRQYDAFRRRIGRVIELEADLKRN